MRIWCAAGLRCGVLTAERPARRPAGAIPATPKASGDPDEREDLRRPAPFAHLIAPAAGLGVDMAAQSPGWPHRELDAVPRPSSLARTARRGRSPSKGQDSNAALKR